MALHLSSQEVRPLIPGPSSVSTFDTLYLPNQVSRDSGGEFMFVWPVYLYSRFSVTSRKLFVCIPKFAASICWSVVAACSAVHHPSITISSLPAGVLPSCESLPAQRYVPWRPNISLTPVNVLYISYIVYFNQQRWIVFSPAVAMAHVQEPWPYRICCLKCATSPLVCFGSLGK